MPAGPILVTGASGFIGGHLVETLIGQGHAVRALIRTGRLESLPESVVSKVTILYGDLRDSEVVNRAVDGVDLVFHLGGVVGWNAFQQQPTDAYLINVQGTLNILEAMRRHGVHRAVIASTSEVYGPPQYAPVDESHRLWANSPYAASKIAAESLTLSYFRSYGLGITVARLFNTYGPRQKPIAVIPTIIEAALSHPEVRLGAVNARRDFTYVSDIVAGLLAASRAENAIGRLINLGSGHVITIQALAERIVALTGNRAAIIGGQSDRLRHTEQHDDLPMQADIRLASEILDWRPQVSLDEGLRHTIDAFQRTMGRSS